MLKKILAVLVSAILMFDLFCLDGISDFWSESSKEMAGIKSALPEEYRGYTFVYGCDYADMRDTLIPAMGAISSYANASVAGMMSYLLSCAAAGAAAGAVGAEAVAGGKTMLTATASQLSSKAAQDAVVFQSMLGSGLLQLTSMDISTWLCGGTAEDFARQSERFKTELGISDYFGFVYAVNSSSPTMIGVAMLWKGGTTLPLGAPVKIFLLPPSLDFNAPPPLIVVKNPRIDFARIGSSLQEQTLMGEVRPTTVPFVFAYEKFNGGIVQRQDGNASVRISVEKGDELSGGTITGKMNLSTIPQFGFGGLREVHLSSPANMGMLCKRFNDDFAFALVLNNDTVMVQGPSYPAQMGSNLKIGVAIKGFHDNPRDIQTENGQLFSWKAIAGEVLKGFSCQGAGVGATYVQDMGSYAELWCKPTRPGKVSVVVATRDGNLVFPDVATVGGSGIEGLWKMRDNGTVIRIIYVPEYNTFRGVVEVDHLQHVDRGDLIWNPITPDPLTPDVYRATESMWDGRGGRTSSMVNLSNRQGMLIYQDGDQTAYFDPITEEEAAGSR